MLDVDEDEKLTGEEEFELLAGPLGLSERRIVPEAVQFPDSDPLGASVAMVTATNSMEETLLQIGSKYFLNFNGNITGVGGYINTVFQCLKCPDRTGSAGYWQ